MTTDDLIERACAGDQAAWDTIVRSYRRRVFNVAYRFVGTHDEAEDLTQDIFLRVFRSIGAFDRRADFQTWLISVSRNLCIDHCHTRRRKHGAITAGLTRRPLAGVVRRQSVCARLPRGRACP